MIPIGPLMVFLQGTRLAAEERALLRHPAVGGVIFFSFNYNDKKQLSDLINEINEVASGLIFATDHEGGRVQRFKDGFTRLPPMRLFGKLFDRDPERALHLIHASGHLVSTELREVGIHTGFSPVLDLFGKSNVIGDRALHTEPDAAVKLAHSFIEGLHDGGLMPVGKHFPGHGTVAGDTHDKVVEDPRGYEKIKASDLKVFRDLTASKMLMAVMTAHVIYPQVDTRPVGLSRHWLIQILRKELEFDGLIFSDDLAMKGIQNIGNGVSAREMLEAGCDMVLICRDRNLLQRSLDDLSDTDIELYASRLGKRWERGCRRLAQGTDSAGKYDTDDATRKKLCQLETEFGA